MNGFDNTGLPLDGPWNWPEDYEHENGNYMNKCRCGRIFHGYKRRTTCKVCMEKRAVFAREAQKELDKTLEARKFLPHLDYDSGYISGYEDGCMARGREMRELKTSTSWTMIPDQAPIVGQRYLVSNDDKSEMFAAYWTFAPFSKKHLWTKNIDGGIHWEAQDYDRYMPMP